MTKKIKILKDGPYQVSGDVPLKQAVIVPDENGIPEKWEDGRQYDTKGKSYALCRCGRSKNKPFCDGQHIKAGFDGSETAGNIPYDEGAEVYKGAKVDMMDFENYCAVGRFCDRGERAWTLAEKSDEASVNMAIEEACNCPSGRLTVVDHKGHRYEPKFEKEIGLIEDAPQNCRGPLWVKGGVEIEGSQGVKYEVRNRVTLCRCGESTNMPFCDASHLNCPHMKGLDEK